MEEVKLHGAWTSPYNHSVIWALKLKGILFEYIEKDLSNKSDLLLQYNPVHKKIPVLVHSGRPICESMVIIEYLEEKCPQHPLVPTYERAEVWFLVKLAQEKGPNLSLVHRTAGEEQEKVKKNSIEMLTMLEDYGPNKGKKFFGDNNINIVNIAFGSVLHWMSVIEEVSGAKLFDAENFMCLQCCMENFKKVPIICENLPDHEKLLACLKR